MMHIYFELTALLLAIFIALVLVRILIGPTVIDRLVGINVIGTKTTVIIVIVGFIYGRVEMFVDIAIAYAMLNFIASIAATKYLQRYKSLDAGGAQDQFAREDRS